MSKFHFLTGVLLMLTIALAHKVNAQQIAQHGLYMLEPYRYNPAFGGLNNALTITGNFRRQWAELPGRPSTQYISAHMPLRTINSGVGLNFKNDELGATRISAATMSYNYILPLRVFVSVGVGLGLNTSSINGDLLRTPEGNYENGINHNDPNIPAGKSSSTNGTLNLGIVSRINAIELGLSAIQTTSIGKRNSDLYYYKPYTHLILYTAYYYQIDDNWKILPSALLKYDLATIQTELDILAYNKNIFGGIGIRGYDNSSIDAVKVMLGGRITERILVAYNFEGNISKERAYIGNTHELLVQFRIKTNFKTTKREKIIYHPRI
ncbi:MAG: PorP/SprF family type IX secretion system membrane protein [Saprospiraceae bacterium]|nr:MAG: Bacteroidetes-specific putative membrane protein [Candidatus Parvibacillus calidus]MCC7149284.1 PorP/SprF family type IX secretion system membrane protein [Saprospiraceae bacterium]WKZ63191.1 MAG: PorP/SprF family type IX secretion system membrane protein [Saprospiraceae bacterium]